MSLDDNHDSVVLAGAKVIQSVLCCDINESFFDISEVDINSRVLVILCFYRILTLLHMLSENSNLSEWCLYCSSI